MHEPVKSNVENYLAGSDSLPREFTAHLSTCAACRQRIAEMQEQSTLLRVLRASEEIDPRAGFYARVIERIESQRPSSIWSIFLEPAFGLRLAMASAVLSVVLGLYLVGSEPVGGRLIQGQATGTTMALLSSDDDAGPTLGGGQDQDRGAVLVSLATYQQEQ